MTPETDAPALLPLLIDAVTGRSCLMQQSASVLAVLVPAFAVVLLASAFAVQDRHRAMSRAPEGPLRRAATVGFVLYTSGSTALFILYGLLLSRAC